MKRFSFLSVMLVGAIAISPAFAQSSDAPVRGSKVKGTPGEIEYNPRFGTMITSGAEKEYITSVIYNYQTGEISLGGEFDPRTGKRLTAAPQVPAMPQDESVPMRGTKVKGKADEIQYNPRFGTQMVSAAEREYVTGLIYNLVSQEIFLGGNYDPRDGRPLRSVACDGVQPPA